MKRVSPESIVHERSSKFVTDVIKDVNVRYVVKLDDVLDKRGVTQQWLAIATGLREAAISDLIKGTKTSLNKLHLMTIMNVLRISDIKELVDIEFEPAIVKQFKVESERWVNEGIIPQEIQTLHRKHIR